MKEYKVQSVLPSGKVEVLVVKAWVNKDLVTRFIFRLKEFRFLHRSCGPASTIHNLYYVNGFSIASHNLEEAVKEYERRNS